MEHKDRISCLAVSQDGRRIVTGSDDKTIRVWDARAFHNEPDCSLADCELRGPDKEPSHIGSDGWIETPDGGLLLWVVHL